MTGSHRLHIAARLENLSVLRGFVHTAALELGVGMDGLADVLLAVDEAATNTVVHGYRECGGSIEVSVERTAEALIVRLRDEADPFDPHCVPAPDLHQPLELRRTGGMGVHLMRQLVDEVHHCAMGTHGNELTLVKRFRPPP